MDLSGKVSQARKAGYSDAEITAYLARDPALSQKVAQAKKAGYSDAEIVGHLSAEPKAGPLRSFIGGVAEGVAGLADTVGQTMGGPIAPTLQAAANVAGLMRGERPAPVTPALPSGAARPFAVTTPKPAGVGSEYARTFGQMLPNAAFPGSGLARIANVVVPTITSETAGQVARAAGAGPRGEMAARVAGGIAGGAAASMRAVPKASPEVVIPKTEQRVGAAVERALSERDRMAGPDVVDRARAAGAPTYQGGGDNLTALAEVVSQSPGPGQQILRRAVRDHAAQSTSRVKQSVGEAFGGKGDYFATLDAAQEQRKAAALPLREAAFGKPVDVERYQAEVAPLMSRVPQSAMRYAAEIAKREGFEPSQIGFEVSPASGEIPEMVAVKTPTMQALHYVKKGMDQELQTHRNALGKLDLEGDPLAAATNSVRGDFGKALRRMNPDYDAFMRTWGDESGQVEALRLGRGVFSSQPEMSAERLRSRFSEMSDAEKDQYRKGVGEALIDQVRRKGGVAEARQLLKNEEFADRIKVAVPDDTSFNSFMKALEREVEMAERNNRVYGGSPTYARQAARADLEAQGADPVDVAAELLDSGFNPARLTGKALKQAMRAIPRKDRSVIGDPAANEMLAKALSDPDEMTRLLNLMEVAKARRAQSPVGLLPPVTAPQITAPALGAMVLQSPAAQRERTGRQSR